MKLVEENVRQDLLSCWLEVKILRFKSCESLLFSNLFQRDCMFVLLEDKQKELHRRVRCIAMDGDIPTVRLSSYFDKRYIFELAFQCHQFGINQHPVADVIPVLLRSDQSASREEAVEKRNDFLDVDCNIVEVMILSFKSCESLLFSNFFQRDCPSVLLEDKQNELHRRVRCIAMDGDIPTVRLSSYFDKRYIFELAFQCHQFGINQHPVADVIPVLLRSDQSASREEAVEKRNVCRSMHTS
ncbi:hypothetical protein DY000_02060463 [Brassica cretica]|uniref:Uncharacterized protein n=1 Tax=Brassica cretica TaxID=69181 RepID=A0ABQ7ATH7_BRACR|nr:hypothetical protein DY000_02060463 [Brassica cretica]